MVGTAALRRKTLLWADLVIASNPAPT